MYFRQLKAFGRGRELEFRHSVGCCVDLAHLVVLGLGLRLLVGKGRASEAIAKVAVKFFAFAVLGATDTTFSPPTSDPILSVAGATLEPALSFPALLTIEIDLDWAMRCQHPTLEFELELNLYLPYASRGTDQGW